MHDGVRSVKSYRRCSKARGERGSRAPGRTPGHTCRSSSQGVTGRSVGASENGVQVQVQDAAHPLMESGRAGRPHSV